MANLTAQVTVQRYCEGWYANVGCSHDGRIWVTHTRHHPTREAARRWARKMKPLVEKAFADLMQGGE